MLRNSGETNRPWTATILAKNNLSSNGTGTVWSVNNDQNTYQKGIQLYVRKRKLYFHYGEENNSNNYLKFKLINWPKNTWKSITVSYDGSKTGGASFNNSFMTPLGFMKPT